MVVKRVWLGILVVILFIFNAGYINSALSDATDVSYAFIYSGFYCSVNSDLNFEFISTSTEDSFEANFLNAMSTSMDSGFGWFNTYGYYKDNVYQSSNWQLLKTMDHKSCNTCKTWCALTDFDPKEKEGRFMYGYLYTLDTLNNVKFRVGSRSTDSAAWYTGARFSFTNLRDYDKTTSLRDYFKNTKSSAFCGGNVADRSTSEGGSGEYAHWTYTDPESTACSLITTQNPAGLVPGMYLIAAGLGGTVESKIGGEVTVESSLSLARFNNEEASVYNSPLKHLGEGFDPNTRYVIVNHLLNSEELNQVFGDHVETQSWLCNAAGGDLITDKYDFTLPADLPVTRLCCGDDTDDAYSFTREEDGKTYLCKDSVWGDGSPKSACEEAVSEKTSDPNVYESSLNIDNTQYDLIKDGVKSIYDGCCGDDEVDYGSVSKIGDRRQYLCYDKTQPTVYAGSYPGYTWLNALTTRYVTTTIKTSTGEVDTISNGLDWYYCDATGTANIKEGIAISENASFVGKNPVGKSACYELFSAEKREVFENGCNMIGDEAIPEKNCCKTQDGETVFVDSIDQCYACFMAGKPDALLPPTDFSGISQTSEDSVEYILKELCPSDPSGCLDNTPSFSSKVKCNDQSNKFSEYNEKACNIDTSMCQGGVLLDALDSTSTNKCCFGLDAKCIDKPPVFETEKDCNEKGAFYPSDNDYVCFGTKISVTNPEGYCCIGILSLEPTTLLSYQSTQPTSFKCLKQNSNNIISQCCYDKSCTNRALATSKYVVDFKNRLQSLGGVQNTLINFDEFPTEDDKRVILDYIFKGRIHPKSNIRLGMYDPNPVVHLDLTQFTYMEFDIAYSSPDLVLWLNYKNGAGIRLGDISSFSTNGDSTNRWHHVVINLKDKAPGVKTFYNLNFESTSKRDIDIVILVDNIILTPTGNDLKYNSLNNYCTGGFEGWIDDLDPPIDTDFANWEEYGAYKLTCNSQAAFGWTGERCCGDDTKLSNYGEIYNDTEKGCFNGSVILNNQSVASVKNIIESSSDTSAFSLYTYKDLLYINDSFVSCQANPSKYDKFYVSLVDTVDKTRKLVETNILSQCAVNGTYYCANGAWRKNILTDTGIREFPETAILLSKAPPGGELLENNFR